MAFEIHQGFKRLITLTFTKADGTQGEVEGVPVWAMGPNQENVLATLAVAADGMSAELAWAGTGEGVLTVTADGDLGTGVFPIIISEQFSFVAPLGAVAGGISVSDEVPV